MYDPKLIEKLERELRQNPKAYQTKVMLLALLGNFYIVFGVFILLVLLILACLSILVLKAFAIKLIAIAGVFLFVVVRSLWVTVDEPTGIEISAKDAPELFKVIERLSGQLNAVKFNHVLITDDFNAAVVQRPRLGIFGWYENYLIIGLPLMQSLKVEQLTAVLAHEFGHLSKNHARTANWIYRQRIRWAQLFTEIEQKVSHVDFIFRPFLKRFVPYFVAYSFPIARANEYEADKISLNLTSAEVVAETLSTVNVIGFYLSENYWPKIFKQAETSSRPNVLPYTGYVQRFSDEVSSEHTHVWLNHSLNVHTNFEDTHPSLSDRLKSIGQVAKVNYPVIGQTSDYLLGQKRLEIATEFDQTWQKSVQYDWQKHHQTFKEQKDYLAQLSEKPTDSLTFEERINYIELTEYVAYQPERAFELKAQLYQDFPEHEHAIYLYAKELIIRKDVQGITLLQQAMNKNAFFTIPSCELLIQYYEDVEDHAQATHFRQMLEQRVEIEMKAAQERETISSNDKFMSHGLAQDELNQLLSKLEKFSSIQKMWLVRKRTKYLNEQPCFVFAFSLKDGMFDKVDAELVLQTINVLKSTITFPGETFLVCSDLSEMKVLSKKIIKTPNSAILQR